MAAAILYAVDLNELRAWVGRADPQALAEARHVIHEAEDFEWEPDEVEVVDRLLERLVRHGQLYEGLSDEERYYLTQVLIDLFDEYVEAEAVSDELSLPQLEAALEPLRRAGGAAAEAALWLTRGRELNGRAPLIPPRVDPQDFLPYFGYVDRTELPAFLTALEQAEREGAEPPGARPGGRGRAGRTQAVLQDVLVAARLCAQTERDLLAFVG